MPQTPSLLTQLSMGAEATDVKVYGPSAFVLEYGQMVEIVIYNTDAGRHPCRLPILLISHTLTETCLCTVHLHGHKFAVVGKSMNTSSDDPVENPPIVEGQANPMRRDTVVAPPVSEIALYDALH